MFFAVKFIVSALILYTIAIWTEKYQKSLKLWMVVVFSIGLLCDITGTTIMFLRRTESPLNIHSFCGYSALLIMLLHLIWAILALIKKDKTGKYFHRFSIYAWVIWVSAFITGIPK